MSRGNGDDEESGGERDNKADKVNGERTRGGQTAHGHNSGHAVQLTVDACNKELTLWKVDQEYSDQF